MECYGILQVTDTIQVAVYIYESAFTFLGHILTDSEFIIPILQTVQKVGSEPKCCPYIIALIEVHV